MNDDASVSLPVRAFMDERLSGVELRLLALLTDSATRGVVSASAEELAAILGVTPRSIYRAKAELEELGYFPRSPRRMKQLALIPDAVHAVTPEDGFDAFWQAYPNKKAKLDAQRAWKKLRPNAPLQTRILADIAQRRLHHKEWLRGFIPYPATYLNGRRWEDDVTPPDATVSPFGGRDSVSAMREMGAFDDD